MYRRKSHLPGKVNNPIVPDEPDQTTPSAEAPSEPTPSPAVEVTPEQEQPAVSSEPVEASAEPVAEPPSAEGEQQAVASWSGPKRECGITTDISLLGNTRRPRIRVV
jgi:hypothetical protein